LLRKSRHHAPERLREDMMIERRRLLAVFDGTRLSKKGDVVVVTLNHRLNAFGFLYLAGACR
jgi:hypothetical protein